MAKKCSKSAKSCEQFNTSKLFVNMSIFTEVINNLFCVVLFDRLLRKVDRI